MLCTEGRYWELICSVCFIIEITLIVLESVANPWPLPVAKLLTNVAPLSSLLCSLPAFQFGV